MKEKIESICNEIKDKISKVSSIQIFENKQLYINEDKEGFRNYLNNLKVEYLGKKGIITELQAGIKDAEDKKEYGMNVNQVRTCFNDNYETKLKELNEEELNKKLEEEKIDISLPATKINTGAPNILESVIEEVEELLMSMGYDVVDGPEIEEDRFNFELLNYFNV